MAAMKTPLQQEPMALCSQHGAPRATSPSGPRPGIRRLAGWIPLFLTASLLAASGLAQAAAVKATEEDIVIPTYLAGDPEPSPMFYFGRGSQGAQGRTYPYPLYDTLTSIKTNKTYRIIYLENEYVRIGVLPEIGGRLFEGVDKSNGYDFIYRQHVIKPALIGLIGAWISGGVEWNIPHHHRATTFLPVQYRLEENGDGSKTIWVGELEVRHRMRWAVGYTLYPGRSYLECKLRILNRTPLVNTMLCFANVAVHVNEDYQVIFPPRTQVATFHHKREFTTWPWATTRYAGADYTHGVDVSWYSNHIAATSMFAWNYEDDFLAGYDHGREAGLMSVANHHIVPGKKLWTWGNGPRGRMWDKILTDTDGPYIELMVGAYSDNQPDYSWLHPFETKSFEMYWYPFRNIGGVKNANLEAAVNLEVATNGPALAKVGFCATRAHRSAEFTLTAGNQVLFREKAAIDPAKPFLKTVSMPAGVEAHDLRAVMTVNGKELIGYSPARLGPAVIPEPVKGPPPPKEIKTIEELWLAGQRLEQFHNAELDPEAYWEEALQRDGSDARVNTSMGIRRLKQARFSEAERHFRKAIERLTTNYTTPKDHEPFYYLGLALTGQGKLDEAFDAYYKATWSETWRSPAYFALAEIASTRGDIFEALDHLERSLQANALHIRALALKASLLRHAGRPREALAVLDFASRQTDPLDVRLLAERWLAGNKAAVSELSATLREHPATGLETASEYGNAGLWQDGAALLSKMIEGSKDKTRQTRVSPLVYYYLGHFAERQGEAAKAAEYRRYATEMSPDYVFPFQWEVIPVLRRAMELNPKDARAPYYLGNLLFDWQPQEAVKLWEQSAALDPSFAMVQRNLAIAYSHQKPTNDLAGAIRRLERAVAGGMKYPRHFAELDALYANTKMAPEKRLALLIRNHEVVSKNDDALSREIGLRILDGQYDESIQLMTGRKFSVWEGGSLDVAEHWVNAHLLRGQQRLAAGQAAAALEDLQKAKTIPENLPSDQSSSSRNAEIDYWIGMAHEAAGNCEKARQSWQKAAQVAPSEERGEGRLSEQQVQSCYKALAQQKLGQTAEAEAALKSILEAATRSLEGDPSNIPSRRRLSGEARNAMAHYLAGLAQLGLNELEKAKEEFTLALQASPDHLGAKQGLRAITSRK